MQWRSVFSDIMPLLKCFGNGMTLSALKATNGAEIHFSFFFLTFDELKSKEINE